MEWSIQQISRLAGTTSRTLRHYDAVGLVPPSRVGENGYRYYDELALVRLQRVLLLRELGLGLSEIGAILDREVEEAPALTTHLSLLRQERDRLARQIAAVEHTITALKGGTELMAETMFDGFDHTQYKDEVEQRWGKDAYARSDAWWRGMSDRDRTSWKAQVEQLGKDWIWLHAARTAAVTLPLLTALFMMVAMPGPATALKLDPENTIYLDLKDGRVVIRLRPDLAPNHVAHIKKLTREGFYDGLVFHRVIDGFMAQTGDPTGTGAGGSKYPDIKAEFNHMPFARGTVGMARSSSPDSANSQFFICFDDATFLDGQYTGPKSDQLYRPG